ncbi:MAG TPA: hypothetical protein VF179_19380 [Thermoanaerobaculia bacterium]|nr:hypothetical protein [Thermoanaerobaculia bacterium]
MRYNEAVGITDRKAVLLRSIAVDHVELSEHSAATVAYQEAIKDIADKDSRGAGELCIQLARVYTEQLGDNRAAADCLVQALQLQADVHPAQSDYTSFETKIARYLDVKQANAAEICVSHIFELSRSSEAACPLLAVRLLLYLVLLHKLKDREKPDEERLPAQLRAMETVATHRQAIDWLRRAISIAKALPPEVNRCEIGDSIYGDKLHSVLHTGGWPHVYGGYLCWHVHLHELYDELARLVEDKDESIRLRELAIARKETEPAEVVQRDKQHEERARPRAGYGEAKRCSLNAIFERLLADETLKPVTRELDRLRQDLRFRKLAKGLDGISPDDERIPANVVARFLEDRAITFGSAGLLRAALRVYEVFCDVSRFPFSVRRLAILARLNPHDAGIHFRQAAQVYRETDFRDLAARVCVGGFPEADAACHYFTARALLSEAHETGEWDRCLERATAEFLSAHNLTRWRGLFYGTSRWTLPLALYHIYKAMLQVRRHRDQDELDAILTDLVHAEVLLRSGTDYLEVDDEDVRPYSQERTALPEPCYILSRYRDLLYILKEVAACLKLIRLPHSGKSPQERLELIKNAWLSLAGIESRLPDISMALQPQFYAMSEERSKFLLKDFSHFIADLGPLPSLVARAYVVGANPGASVYNLEIEVMNAGSTPAQNLSLAIDSTPTYDLDGPAALTMGTLTPGGVAVVGTCVKAKVLPDRLRATLSCTDDRHRSLAKRLEIPLSRLRSGADALHIIGSPRSPQTVRADALVYKVLSDQDLFVIDRAYYGELLSHLKRIPAGASTRERQVALENLVSYLFSCVSIFDVYHDVRSRFNQIDQIIRVHGLLPGALSEVAGTAFIVECKNTAQSVGVRVIDNLNDLLATHGCRLGILATRTDLAGEAGVLKDAQGKRIWHFARNRNAILALTLADLESIAKEEGCTLLKVLDEKYVKLKFMVPE